MIPNHPFRISILTATLVVSAAIATAGCHREASASTRPPASAGAAGTTFGQAAPPFSTPPVLQGTPDIAALVEKVKPSVVNITTKSHAHVEHGISPDLFDFFRRDPFGSGGMGPNMVPRERRPSLQARALGTGFVVDRTGYVVTNNHVIDGADDITIKLSDGREFKAKVVGGDSKLDVALLKLDGANNLPAATFGDSDKLRVGEYVVAEGNPFGLGQTVTMGIVSAKDRSIGAGPYDDFIQTDASINPGNSGGPLFNLQGEVVGMNTAINPQGQGIGFAIPSNLMKDSLVQLRESGHVARGKLGLVFQPVTVELARALGQSAPAGALVAEVESEGPAAKAGIKSGDLITKVDTESVQDGVQLPRMIARHRPGTVVAVTFNRGGAEHTAQVTLDTLPSDGDASTSAADPAGRNAVPSSGFGLTLQSTKEGVRVVDASGQTQNLSPGDIILEIDGKNTSTPAQVSHALAQAQKENRPALARIKRADRTLFVAVEVGKS